MKRKTLQQILLVGAIIYAVHTFRTTDRDEEYKETKQNKTIAEKVADVDTSSLPRSVRNDEALKKSSRFFKEHLQKHASSEDEKYFVNQMSHQEAYNRVSSGYLTIQEKLKMKEITESIEQIHDFEKRSNRIFSDARKIMNEQSHLLTKDVKLPPGKRFFPVVQTSNVYTAYCLDYARKDQKLFMNMFNHLYDYKLEREEVSFWCGRSTFREKGIICDFLTGICNVIQDPIFTDYTKEKKVDVAMDQYLAILKSLLNEVYNAPGHKCYYQDIDSMHEDAIISTVAQANLRTYFEHFLKFRKREEHEKITNECITVRKNQDGSEYLFYNEQVIMKYFRETIYPTMYEGPLPNEKRMVNDMFHYLVYDRDRKIDPSEKERCRLRLIGNHSVLGYKMVVSGQYSMELHNFEKMHILNQRKSPLAYLKERKQHFLYILSSQILFRTTEFGKIITKREFKIDKAHHTYLTQLMKEVNLQLFQIADPAVCKRHIHGHPARKMNYSQDPNKQKQLDEAVENSYKLAFENLKKLSNAAMQERCAQKYENVKKYVDEKKKEGVERNKETNVREQVGMESLQRDTHSTWTLNTLYNNINSMDLAWIVLNFLIVSGFWQIVEGKLSLIPNFWVVHTYIFNVYNSSHSWKTLCAAFIHRALLRSKNIRHVRFFRVGEATRGAAAINLLSGQLLSNLASSIVGGTPNFFYKRIWDSENQALHTFSHIANSAVDDLTSFVKLEFVRNRQYENMGIGERVERVSEQLGGVQTSFYSLGMYTKQLRNYLDWSGSIDMGVQLGSLINTHAQDIYNKNIDMKIVIASVFKFMRAKNYGITDIQNLEECAREIVKGKECDVGIYQSFQLGYERHPSHVETSSIRDNLNFESNLVSKWIKQGATKAGIMSGIVSEKDMDDLYKSFAEVSEANVAKAPLLMAGEMAKETLKKHFQGLSEAQIKQAIISVSKDISPPNLHRISGAIYRMGQFMQGFLISDEQGSADALNAMTDELKKIQEGDQAIPLEYLIPELVALYKCTQATLQAQLVCIAETKKNVEFMISTFHAFNSAVQIASGGKMFELGMQMACPGLEKMMQSEMESTSPWTQISQSEYHRHKQIFMGKYPELNSSQMELHYRVHGDKYRRNFVDYYGHTPETALGAHVALRIALDTPEGDEVLRNAEGLSSVENAIMTIFNYRVATSDKFTDFLKLFSLTDPCRQSLARVVIMDVVNETMSVFEADKTAIKLDEMSYRDIKQRLQSGRYTHSNVAAIMHHLTALPYRSCAPYSLNEEHISSMNKTLQDPMSDNFRLCGAYNKNKNIPVTIQKILSRWFFTHADTYKEVNKAAIYKNLLEFKRQFIEDLFDDQQVRSFEVKALKEEANTFIRDLTKRADFIEIYTKQQNERSDIDLLGYAKLRFHYHAIESKTYEMIHNTEQTSLDLDIPESIKSKAEAEVLTYRSDQRGLTGIAFDNSHNNKLANLENVIIEYENQILIHLLQCIQNVEINNQKLGNVFFVCDMVNVQRQIEDLEKRREQFKEITKIYEKPQKQNTIPDFEKDLYIALRQLENAMYTYGAGLELFEEALLDGNAQPMKALLREAFQTVKSRRGEETVWYNQGAYTKKEDVDVRKFMFVNSSDAINQTIAKNKGYPNMAKTLENIEEIPKEEAFSHVGRYYKVKDEVLRRGSTSSYIFPKNVWGPASSIVRLPDMAISHYLLMDMEKYNMVGNDGTPVNVMEAVKASINNQISNNNDKLLEIHNLTLKEEINNSTATKLKKENTFESFTQKHSNIQNLFVQYNKIEQDLVLYNMIKHNSCVPSKNIAGIACHNLDDPSSIVIFQAHTLSDLEAEHPNKLKIQQMKNIAALNTYKGRLNVPIDMSPIASENSMFELVNQAELKARLAEAQKTSVDNRDPSFISALLQKFQNSDPNEILVLPLHTELPKGAIAAQTHSVCEYQLKDKLVEDSSSKYTVDTYVELAKFQIQFLEKNAKNVLLGTNANRPYVSVEDQKDLCIIGSNANIAFDKNYDKVMCSLIDVSSNHEYKMVEQGINKLMNSRNITREQYTHYSNEIKNMRFPIVGHLQEKTVGCVMFSSTNPYGFEAYTKYGNVVLREQYSMYGNLYREASLLITPLNQIPENHAITVLDEISKEYANFVKTNLKPMEIARINYIGTPQSTRYQLMLTELSKRTDGSALLDITGADISAYWKTISRKPTNTTTPLAEEPLSYWNILTDPMSSIFPSDPSQTEFSVLSWVADQVKYIYQQSKHHRIDPQQTLKDNIFKLPANDRALIFNNLRHIVGDHVVNELETVLVLGNKIPPSIDMDELGKNVELRLGALHGLHGINAHRNFVPHQNLSVGQNIHMLHQKRRKRSVSPRLFDKDA
tara:strand:- start:12677 stop:19756 length:7080 start_codon:yes stop_codon:yes gene_type:complete